MFKLETYEPINTLKPVAENVWIVDGPVIGMNWLWLKLPFTTRMTIIRLSDGDLWVHSPTPLTDALRQEVDALGRVAHIVAPNKIHYWWVGAWQAAHPQAISYAAPRVEEKAREIGVEFDHVLGPTPVPEWHDEIRHVLVPGHFMTEADFFHPASHTLVLADLIENFEASKTPSLVWRFLCRISGVAAPHGSMPRDLRATFAGHHGDVKQAVEKMLSWKPARIILSHGQWYPDHAAEELRRAFGWAGVR
ncbi:MAG: DUF4336 domain-containing protein [Rhizobiales bacterium]|nr:DUF4336 domain-containing protein [Hyphomicrobiales bacterium]